ncbi:pre-mRNA cleavage and polyadenylation factor (CPF) complex subunit, partial [Elasticomyces elasticus]
MNTTAYGKSTNAVDADKSFVDHEPPSPILAPLIGPPPYLDHFDELDEELLRLHLENQRNLYVLLQQLLKEQPGVATTRPLPQETAGSQSEETGDKGSRPVTDYGSTMAHFVRGRRPKCKRNLGFEIERPSASYVIDMLPPAARREHAVDTIPAKHLHSSLNKIKHPVNVVKWTPEGRRLLTASTSGEFTLWNGMGFNFETIMQAHDCAVRAAVYSHSNDWLVSSDQDGIVKYFQPNFNNVKVIQAHSDPVRDLAFAPTDSKFVTASDDATLKIFDFAGGVE